MSHLRNAIAQLAKIEPTKYIVGVGGEPTGPGSRALEFDNLEDAVDACLDMALEMAHNKGIDRETIDVYDHSDAGGSIGACPQDDDGFLLAGSASSILKHPRQILTFLV